MKTIGWIKNSGTPADGVKAELIETCAGGVIRVKLLEPTTAPGWKMNDVITIMAYMFKRKYR